MEWRGIEITKELYPNLWKWAEDYVANGKMMGSIAIERETAESTIKAEVERHLGIDIVRTDVKDKIRKILEKLEKEKGRKK